MSKLRWCCVAVALGIQAQTPTATGVADGRLSVSPGSAGPDAFGQGSVSAGPPGPLSPTHAVGDPAVQVNLEAAQAAAAAAGSGIIYTCDPSIEALSATACNTLNTTIAGIYKSAFNNANASIYIKVGSPGVYGNSGWSFNWFGYSDFQNALTASAADANDATAIADSVPPANPYPSSSVGIVSALQRALGLSSTPCLATSACYEGTITMGYSTQYYFRTGEISGDQFDFFTLVEHETDEILGTPSCALGCGYSDTVFPPDFFRYHSDGTRSFAPGTNDTCSTSDSTNACFSLDGVSMLQQYNNVSGGGDAGDWVTNCGTPRVQDVAICSGTAGVDISPSAEILVLDVVGYTLRTPSDFNHAGHPDVIWVEPKIGWAQVWYLGGDQGASITGAANLTKANPWNLVGIGDFNRDGNPDVVWQDPVSGAVQVWYLGGPDGVTLLSATNITNENPWKVVSVADFNQDGHPDLLWEDPASGFSQIWYMGGSEGVTLLGAADLDQTNPWHIAGTGDFNNDGTPDVLWQDPVSGTVQIWYMGGTTSGAQGSQLISAANLTGPVTTNVVAIADFNQDGHPDVVFQDPTTGAATIYFYDGAQGTNPNGTAVLSGANPWYIAGPH